MYERFTDRARKVMQLSATEARRFNHEYIGTEHILLGLIAEGGGVQAVIITNLGHKLDDVKAAVEKRLNPGPSPMTLEKIPLTPRAAKVIELAKEDAQDCQYKYVGTEHLLIACAREKDGVASQVLASFGMTYEALKQERDTLLGFPAPPNPLARYVEDDKQQKTRENNFTYHAPKEGQPERYRLLRSTAGELSKLLNEQCPISRELSLAQTHLEEAIFWANAAIARNE